MTTVGNEALSVSAMVQYYILDERYISYANTQKEVPHLYARILALIGTERGKFEIM